MEPLFLNESVLGTFPKEADVKLGRNPEDWMKEVVEHLHQAYPWLADAKIQVNFNRIDPEQGVGVGQIQLDEQVAIPIIVDNFRLSPLDVYWWNGKLHPLTRDGLQEVLKGTNLGTPVEPGHGFSSDMALFTRTQPPYDGRYVYASVLGLSADALKGALGKAFGSAEALDYALKKNAHFNQVLKDWFVAVKAAGFQPTKSMLPKAKLPVAQAPKKLPSIKTGGTFGVPLDGKVATCLVANHVVGLDGRVREGVMAAFELGGSRYAYSDRGFFGEPAEPVKVASLEPRTGWGAFVFSKNGHVIATEPVRVLFRGRTSEGLDKIAVEGIGGSANLLMTDKVRDWTPLGDGDVAVNPGWKFLPLSSRVNTGDEAFDLTALEAQPQKTAAAARPKTPASVNLIKEAFFVQSARVWFPLSSRAGNELAKVAVEVDDDEAKNTVDAILGLNFINDENAYKFADQADKMASAKEACAKLLLASRLGLPIPASPLKTAMYALDAAERDLRQYNSSLVEQQ